MYWIKVTLITYSLLCISCAIETNDDDLLNATINPIFWTIHINNNETTSTTSVPNPPIPTNTTTTTTISTIEYKLDNLTTSPLSVANNTINTTTTITNTTLINFTIITTIPNNNNNTLNTNNITGQLEGKRKSYPDRFRRVDLNVHETNMMDREVLKVRHVLNATISRDYGSRKMARVLKLELDEAFKDQKYRFSVIISRNASHLISKRLYGVWVSATANNKHYLMVGSYKANKAKKLSEGQMDRIEDWTSVYFITYEDMIAEQRNDKVAKMLKEKLDLNYGKSNNTWAVVAYRHPTSIRAKRLFDSTPQIQFKRIDGTVWLAFRGGEDIPVNHRFQGIH